jgi:N-acylglucosamine 2-epimerase
LTWHERIREWSFAHYPVAGHGEWRQKLDRRGREIQQTLVLPVKDPFHLPRALLYCCEILDRLAGPAKSNG